jgi:phospholipase/carboxylesterase
MHFDPEHWLLQRPNLVGLNSILVKPVKSKPNVLLVLCHGYGAPGTDLVNVFEDILHFIPDDADKPAFLFPEAPVDLSEEGIGGGRAWWPLNMAQLMQMSATNSFGEMRDTIPDGIDLAREMLCKCIHECCEQQGWQDQPIVLGGFSQGAMLAVDTALRGTLEHLVGLVVFSGALICESIWAQTQDKLKSMLFVQSHGRQDQILPIQTGRWLSTFLRNAGCVGSLEEFNGPHTISSEAIERTAALLSQVR